MASGRFITFEGGEGSGKSTQAKRLLDALRARGVDALLTREPGGSPFAEQMRELILNPAVASHTPLSEALLFYAARADHLDKTIRPALGVGRWVICDRFSDSTRVYQCDAGGLPLEVFNTLEQMVVTLTFPDLTFILDVPAEVGLGRVATRRLAQALSGERAGRLREARRRVPRAPARGLPRHRRGRAASLRRDRRHGRPGRHLRRGVGAGGAPHAGAAALMARAPAVQEFEALPEADRLDEFPHPRETRALFGHEAVEAEMAQAMAGGRMHHAWLLAGREGIGKATLAYRLARHVLARAEERDPVRAEPGGGGREHCRPPGHGAVASGPAGAAPALRHAHQAFRDRHPGRRGAAAEIVPRADRRRRGLARRDRRLRPTTSTSTRPTRC